MKGQNVIVINVYCLWAHLHVITVVAIFMVFDSFKMLSPIWMHVTFIAQQRGTNRVDRNLSLLQGRVCGSLPTSSNPRAARSHLRWSQRAHGCNSRQIFCEERQFFLFSSFCQATCQFTSSGVWSCVCQEGYDGDGLLCYGNAAVVSEQDKLLCRIIKSKVF